MGAPLVLMLGLAMLVGAMGESKKEPRREAPVIEHPVYIPCAVPAWEGEPKDLEDMERRAAKARKMMEDCGAMIHEAERAK